MKFFKYPSIENHYQKKFLYHVLETLPTDTQFYITEKIHGANFAIYISQDEIKFASRNEFLGDKKFYNYKEVVSKYQDCFDIIQQAVQGDEYYIIYGEIFGGSIQKECYYKDQQDFVCFDIAIVKDDMIKSYAADKIIAKLPKSVSKLMGEIKTTEGAVSCYFEAHNEAWTSESGLNVLTHELCVTGESGFCGD